MAADFGSATFAVGQGVGSFTSFLPKITDVRKASKDDADFVADLRTGELAGAVITIGVGAIASSLVQSSTPLITGIFISLVIIALYESILRREPIPTANKPERITLRRSVQ